MILAIFILTGVQIYLEMKICNRNGAPWQRKLHALNRKSPMFGLILSVILSMLCAFAFGAAGMIVLVAGLLSTAITQFYYGLSDRLFNDIDNRVNQAKTWALTSRDRWYGNAVVTLKTIRMMVHILLFPFVVLFKLLYWINSRAAARQQPRA